jgi:IS5 family transposase
MIPFDRGRALVLQPLDNLSGDQAEYQLRDRLSLMRFLGIGIADAVAGAKTLWLDREALAKASAVEDLFDLLDGALKETEATEGLNKATRRKTGHRSWPTTAGRTARWTKKHECSYDG